jgi:hypothetical protein
MYLFTANPLSNWIKMRSLDRYSDRAAYPSKWHVPLMCNTVASASPKDSLLSWQDFYLSCWNAELDLKWIGWTQISICLEFVEQNMAWTLRILAGHCFGESIGLHYGVVMARNILLLRTQHWCFAIRVGILRLHSFLLYSIPCPAKRLMIRSEHSSAESDFEIAFPPWKMSHCFDILKCLNWHDLVIQMPGQWLLDHQGIDAIIISAMPRAIPGQDTVKRQYYGQHWGQWLVAVIEDWPQYQTTQL